MSDTQPNDPSDIQPDLPSEPEPASPADPQPDEVSDTQPRNARKFGFFLRPAFWITALVLLVAILLGAGGGYSYGTKLRLDTQKATVVQSLGEQIKLAQQDFDAKKYVNSRARLEFILKQDPAYPGAADLLTKLMVEAAITPTLTLTPTPTMTPTPDLRSQQTIFTQIQQSLQSSKWTDALAELDALRKTDPNYKTAQVDGMYYMALRNRGMDEIIGNREFAQTTNLEGGIYDLTLAERFGPLDGFSNGTRTWARYYIIGASFWQLDWPQAVNYFGQVYENAPNLRDASNFTAAMRYHDALLNYGDEQADASRLKDRCLALDSWSKAASISPLNNDYAYKFNQLDLECHPPTATPTVAPAPGG